MAIPATPVEFPDFLKKVFNDIKLKNAALVAVMGATGSGKSTFINKACGRDEMTVGDSLVSCTADIKLSSIFKLNGRDVCLIDTPGFDDTNRKDVDVLGDIAGHIACAYKNNIKLAGVLYLHRISDNRITGVTKRNIKMFHNLCGYDAMKNIAVITTRWDLVTETEGASREREIRTNPSFFKDAITNGAGLIRHLTNTTHSAQEILSDLIVKSEPVALKIQKELVDENKNLHDTAAGAELNRELREQIQKYKDEIEQIKTEMKERQQKGDNQIADLREEINDIKRQKTQAERAREEMRVDYQELRRKQDTGK
ncbi:hypothetical protein GYMLUDRAFT_234181 [Collybiopsis luxurians FD-317 M1]|uniref:G domain-containing protein n=1 Tax=Collybiopsis luxurians FD-317 M1 TaxID=944289 RepID=A0A0D0C103_9AGAR|nr:hypothetical protein GYMLUDRAFT_234181 [Collybiopsis luxurians FD-317 M1]